jgi:16S rRNA (guanine527-N7)-methyltransferase
VDPATKSRLVEGATALGVRLEEDAVGRLDRYLSLLLQWNRRINLTAITEPREIIERHFLDSLAVAPVLEGVTTLIDVGSGAGFPGAVLATVRPGLRVTAIDTVRKKVAFLETLRMELAPNLEPLAVRHSELIDQGRQFDAAISRATWDPSDWVREGAPLVRPGGLLLAMQSADQEPPGVPPGFSSLAPLVYPMEGQRRTLQRFQREG